MSAFYDYASKDFSQYNMKQTTGTIFYLKRDVLYDNAKPYFWYIPPLQLNGAPITNQEHPPIDVSVTNLRGQEHDFTLNKTGLEVTNNPLNVRYSFDTLQADVTLMTEYEHEIEQFLERKLGAEKVVVFDQEVS